MPKDVTLNMMSHAPSLERRRRAEAPPKMMPGQEPYTAEQTDVLYRMISEIAEFEEMYGSEEVLLKEGVLDTEEYTVYNTETGERKRGE